MPVANAEEATKSDDRVCDLPADFVDQDILDTPEVIACGIVDAGPLDIVSADEPPACVPRIIQ
jgi:hypothetical protein